jgi:hypothetical protein
MCNEQIVFGCVVIGAMLGFLFGLVSVYPHVKQVKNKSTIDSLGDICNNFLIVLCCALIGAMTGVIVGASFPLIDAISLYRL